MRTWGSRGTLYLDRKHLGPKTPTTVKEMDAPPCVYPSANPSLVLSVFVDTCSFLHTVAHVKGKKPGALCIHTSEHSQLSGTARPLEGTSEHQGQMQPNPVC